MPLEEEILQQVMAWVLETGKIIKQRMGESFEIEPKTGKSDLVTEIDREVETYLVNQIRCSFPEHNVLGEENIRNIHSDSASLWIIDPIDGTSNLINRKQDFTVSVAYCYENQGTIGVVYDVVSDKLFYARRGCGAFLNGRRLGSIDNDNLLEDELIALVTPWNNVEEMKKWPQLYRLAEGVRGVRLSGATTLELCDIATGMLGGYVQYHVHAWDYAAGRIILEEIGGKFSDLDGNEIGLTYHGSLVVAGKGIHEQIIRELRNHSSRIRRDYAEFWNAYERTVVVAHRGNWRQAPENSLSAIQCSIDSGVDIVEIDVRRTKDGHLILMHDKTVNRMTNGTGSVADLTLEQIRALKLKFGKGGESGILTSEQVPTLKEVMLLVKDQIVVNLDKCWGDREEVYRIVVETGTVDQALFKSKADPEEVLGFLENKPQRPEYMQMIDETNLHLLDRLEQIVSLIRPRAFELLFSEEDSPIFSTLTTQQLKGRCRIWINTLTANLCGGHTDEISLSDPQLGWDWLRVRGANMIQTDFPLELIHHLKEDSHV